jgi:hypothetical protein
MNRALLSALALCFAVMGCDSQKAAEPPKPKTAAVVAVPPEAPKAPAASAGQDAQPVQVTQNKTGAPGAATVPACKGGNHCQVDVAVTGEGTACRITKNPDTLHVARGRAEKITWKLGGGSSSWSFDTIKFAAGAPFACRAQGPHYECDDANSESSKTPHRYTIHLKDASGRKCSNDPTIVNGSDDDNQPEPL